MAAKYFAIVPLGYTEPTGLLRFFDENRLPEYYSIDRGWVTDSALYGRLASGEVSESDQISIEDAAKLVAKWGGSL